MVIDIIFLLVLVLAIIKGLRRGFIVAVFSFIAIIVGVAAAMKLSYIVASQLQQSLNTGKQWLPVLSFFIVFFIVVMLVRWIADIIQAALKFAMLGWLNKTGGIILYTILYLAVLSVFLFYVTKMGLLKEETISASQSYALVEPFGEKVINAVSYIIPVFKNIFQQLSDFFSNVAAKQVAV